jgi:hypothetical protein
MVLNHLADYYFWQGQLDKVDKLAKKALQTCTAGAADAFSPGIQAESMYLLGRKFHKEGDFPMAFAHYDGSKKHVAAAQGKYGGAAGGGAERRREEGEPGATLVPNAAVQPGPVPRGEERCSGKGDRGTKRGEREREREGEREREREREGEKVRR